MRADQGRRLKSWIALPARAGSSAVRDHGAESGKPPPGPIRTALGRNMSPVPTAGERWVVIKGSRRVALRAANVEAVHEKKDGGSILRVVSGQEYEVTEYLDDVLDAVDGSNIVPLTASP